MGTEFFVPSRAFTVGDVARLTGAEPFGSVDLDKPVLRLASATQATSDSLVFIDGKRNAKGLEALQAAAVLCQADIVPMIPEGVAVLVHRRPQLAFARVGRAMFPETEIPRGLTSETGISASAVVDATARIEPDAVIEAGAVIGADVEIGSGTTIAANAVIGSGCRIGRGGYIGSNVSVRYALIGDRVVIHAGASIGKDGFGFVPGDRGLERMPQLGRVIIQNDVEIGANTTVDRGALGDTVIGEGTKIDNLVQIAHNVRIGRACVIAGHCGISGSVTLGDYVMLGGRVGIADHIKVGDGAQIGAAAGVMDNVPAGERWGGAPAVPIRNWFRQVSIMKELTSKGKAQSND